MLTIHAVTQPYRELLHPSFVEEEWSKLCDTSTQRSHTFIPWRNKFAIYIT